MFVVSWFYVDFYSCRKLAFSGLKPQRCSRKLYFLFLSEQLNDSLLYTTPVATGNFKLNNILSLAEMKVRFFCLFSNCHSKMQSCLYSFLYIYIYIYIYIYMDIFTYLHTFQNVLFSIVVCVTLRSVNLVRRGIRMSWTLRVLNGLLFYLPGENISIKCSNIKYVGCGAHLWF